MKNKKNLMLYNSMVEELEYIFDFKLENDKIHIVIKENNKFVPYIYEGFFTLEDFINHHKAFSSCSNVEEILPHLFNLFYANKIVIRDIGYKDARYMLMHIYDISVEVTTKLFRLERKMVENKDDALMELYHEQKRENKKLQEIKKLITNDEIDIDSLREKILKIVLNEDENE